MKKYSILVFLFVITFVMSCKKDDPAPTPTKTKTEIISAHSWQVNAALASGILSIYQKGGTSNLIDLSKITLVFKADGTLSGTDQNGTAFSGAKWVFASSETKVSFSNLPIPSFNNITFDIVQLTEANFDAKGDITYQGQSAPGSVLKLIP